MITLGAWMILGTQLIVLIGLLIVHLEVRRNRIIQLQTHAMINIFMDELTRVTAPMMNKDNTK